MNSGTNNFISRFSSLLWTKATMLPLNYSAFDRLRIPKFGHTLLSLLSSVILLLFFSSCGGKGNSTPSNVGGGYTLQVSGGTLNDGSGYNGLVVLATLRDSEGNGPTYPWTVTITGPDIPADNPLTADYDMWQNYMSWEWAGFDPAGDYLVTAVNNDGSLTLSQSFLIKSASTIARPAPSAGTSGTSITLFWSGITGAGVYYYEVCPPTSSETCKDGATTGLVGTATFASSYPGDYLIRVRAYTSDRLALYSSTSASPSLPPQENVSEYSFSFPVNGDPNAAKYTLKAAGGVLDYDLTGPNGAIYGLALWTSLTDNNAAPLGNWNITIKNPSGVEITNFIYPAGNEHYAYWYYGIEPVAGTYTVTATYGSTINKTAQFTLADLTPPALVPLSDTDITASLVPNQTNADLDDISVSWTAVTKAESYYVNLWAEVYNSATKRNEYQEVWGGWVSGMSVRILNGDIDHGLACDVYVTAYQVDMSTTATPPASVTRADMSENYYGYPLTFLTP